MRLTDMDIVQEMAMRNARWKSGLKKMQAHARPNSMDNLDREYERKFILLNKLISKGFSEEEARKRLCLTD